MHFRLRDFTVWIPRFADYSTKTRIRTNRKKLFPKEIFIRFHKQNKNFEISFQKMDFNFAFTNREKGNVRTKWWNTSVILLLTNNIDISRKSRSWTDRITDKIWSLFWTIYTLRRFSSRAVFAVTCHDADSSDF